MVHSLPPTGRPGGVLPSVEATWGTTLAHAPSVRPVSAGEGRFPGLVCGRSSFGARPKPRREHPAMPRSPGAEAHLRRALAVLRERHGGVHLNVASALNEFHGRPHPALGSQPRQRPKLSPPRIGSGISGMLMAQDRRGGGVPATPARPSQTCREAGWRSSDLQRTLPGCDEVEPSATLREREKSPSQVSSGTPSQSAVDAMRRSGRGTGAPASLRNPPSIPAVSAASRGRMAVGRSASDPESSVSRSARRSPRRSSDTAMAGRMAPPPAIAERAALRRASVPDGR